MIRRHVLLFSFVVCSSHAGLDEHQLDVLAHQQNYGALKKIIYEVESSGDAAARSQVEVWLQTKADEGHVPLMYFLVRHYALSNFKDYDPRTISEALQYMFLCLIRIRQDYACCLESEPSFSVYEMFKRRFDYFFTPSWFPWARMVILPQQYAEALNQATLWLERRDVANFPSPAWIAFCDEPTSTWSYEYLTMGGGIRYQQVNPKTASQLFTSQPYEITGRRNRATRDALGDFKKCFGLD